jgi:DNA-binding beta-propeller fold protein YncE
MTRPDCTFLLQVAALAAAVGIALAPARAFPAGFVYVNDNLAGASSVSGFAVDVAGSLSEIATSPFPTAGDGSGRGLFASNRIVVSRARSLLFAGNDRSGSISAFAIDPVSGDLAPIPGSPFLAAGLTGAGMTLAVTPDGRYLMAGSVSASVIRVFEIDAVGALTETASSPFLLPLDSGPAGMKVSPDGRFLAVALTGFSGGQGGVGMFLVSGAGALMLAPGSPFRDGGAGRAASVAWSYASDRLFVGEATSGTTLVDVFDVAEDGGLAPVPGSPFNPGAGLNSNVVLLHQSGRFLFASNQASGSITVLAIGIEGGLAPVPGSPFAMVSAGAPGGMAVDPAGEFLYVTTLTNALVAFQVATSGTLEPLPGSPFTGSQPSALQSVAFFLACPPIALSPQSLADGRTGELYAASITADGGIARYVFAVTAGALPPGLVLSPSGRLEGTPSGGGAFAFTVTARDADGCAGSASYAMTVIADSEPPRTTATPSTPANTNGWNRETVVVRLAATDNPGGSGVARIHYALTGAQEGAGVVEGDVVSVPVTAEGETTISYFGVDAAGNTEESRQHVVRLDWTAPDMTCAVAPNLLWPPNHELMPVTVSVVVRDGLSGPGGFALTGSGSSEPDAHAEDGDASGDIQGFAPDTPDASGWLRAERLGSGSGRLYTLAYTGRDLAGNTASCAATVSVPHSNPATE